VIRPTRPPGERSAVFIEPVPWAGLGWHSTGGGEAGRKTGTATDSGARWCASDPRYFRPAEWETLAWAESTKAAKSWVGRHPPPWRAGGGGGGNGFEAVRQEPPGSHAPPEVFTVSGFGWKNPPAFCCGTWRRREPTMSLTPYRP